MLKFQKDYTTTLATFEDLIITTYVIIDDLYQHIAPPQRFPGGATSNGPACPTLRSSPSASVASWLGLTQKMHGIPL